MAECQAAEMLAVMAPSRASSLPQWICGEPVICVHPRLIVGASLLAMAECQAAETLAVMAPSRASSLPQWICDAHVIYVHP